jgi:hypothetical protein
MGEAMKSYFGNLNLFRAIDFLIVRKKHMLLARNQQTGQKLKQTST